MGQWPLMEDCVDCDGSGSLSDDTWVTCPFCDGNGMVCAECGFAVLDCTCEDDEVR